MAHKRSAVIGVFDSREQAERAVDALHQAGFTANHISVVMHHDPKGDVPITDMDASKAAYVTGETKAGQGAAVGALAGALGGTALGLAAAFLPGVGPVLTVGTLAGVIAGLGAGAASGGLVGALVGQDFPEQEARFYESELKAGRVLVGVHGADRLDEARAILDRIGGYHAHSPQAATGAAGAGVLHAPPTQTMPATEEPLPPPGV